jgi:hypothetical protein
MAMNLAYPRSNGTQSILECSSLEVSIELSKSGTQTTLWFVYKMITVLTTVVGHPEL